MNNYTVNELIILGMEYVELYRDDSLTSFLKWLSEKPRRPSQDKIDDPITEKVRLWAGPTHKIYT
jgi:hypothetical protein